MKFLKISELKSSVKHIIIKFLKSRKDKVPKSFQGRVKNDKRSSGKQIANTSHKAILETEYKGAILSKFWKNFPPRILYPTSYQ